MRVASCEMRVAGREMRLRVARYGLQNANDVLRVARYELHLPNVEGLGNSLAYAYGVSMAYLCNSFVLSGINFIFGMVLVKDNRHQPHTSLLW